MSEPARPPPRTPAPLRPTTSFVGRAAELDLVGELLRDARLVTLTGAGGIGKTRLALEVSDAIATRHDDGVWVVELGGLRPEDDVAAAVAATLGHVRTREDTTARLVAELAGQSLLLVLDNCEHVLASAREIVDALIRGAPGVRVLATSREPLGIVGERVVGLRPLQLPAPTASDAATSEAVRLLADRAVVADSTFVLDEDNLAAVVGIVERLDGLPLAIELAAVRLRSLSARDLLELMSNRFAVLNRGNETALPRHRTLRAMAEWSLDLCTPAQRRMWARMSVFAGSASLAAVLAVCSDDASPAGSALDDLDDLVMKSVVTVETFEGATRYRLLETLAELGRELLRGFGDSDVVHRRHAEHYRGVIARTHRQFWSHEQLAAKAEIALERTNLAPACAYLLEHRVDDGQAVLQVADHLRIFWISGSRLAEGRQAHEAALAASSEPTLDRVTALVSCARIAMLQSDREACHARLTEARLIADRHGTPGLMARISVLDGVIAGFTDPHRGAELLAGAVDVLIGAGDVDGWVVALVMLAVTYSHLGRHAEASATADRCFRLVRPLGEHWARSYALWARGHAAWAGGDLDAAIDDARQSLVLKYEFGDLFGAATALGLLARATGDRGDHTRAATLLGIAATLWTTLGSGFDAHGPELGGRYLATRSLARAALGDAAFEAALAVGRGLGHEPGRRFAVAPPTPTARPAEDPQQDQDPRQNQVARQSHLAPTARSGSDPPLAGPTAGGVDTLSRRELEVAELVARGLSNKQIAQRLVVSPRTVEGHVERALAKLEFRSRVEIAAWVVGGRRRHDGWNHPSD